MTMKPHMVDMGWWMGKVEETRLPDGARSAQLVIVQPSDEGEPANSLTITDLQGIRNLQEMLYDFLVDFDTEPNEQEMKKVIDSNGQP